MKKLITLLGITMALNISCTGQPVVFGERPVELENFDFNLNVNEFYPQKYMLTGEPWEQDDDQRFYRIPTKSGEIPITKETVEDPYSPLTPKPQWNEYQSMAWSSEDRMATFGTYTFNAVDLITTTDNKLMLINAFISRISVAESEEFIRFLTEKYGQPKQSQAGGYKHPYTILTWVLNDRVIKYCAVFDDEKGTIGLYVDKENGTVEPREKKPHYEGYLFVIKKEYEATLVGNLRSGALSYCH